MSKDRDKARIIAGVVVKALEGASSRIRSFSEQLLAIIDQITSAQDLAYLDQMLLKQSDPVLGELLRTLKQGRLLHLLPFVVDELIHFCDRQEKIVELQVETSRPLSPQQIILFESKLASMMGMKVRIVQRIDETLRTGVRILIPPRRGGYLFSTAGKDLVSALAE